MIVRDSFGLEHPHSALSPRIVEALIRTSGDTCDEWTMVSCRPFVAEFVLMRVLGADGCARSQQVG